MKNSIKKTIIFLFFSGNIFAQTSTGREQKFPYGIRNSLPQTVTMANINYLTTTGNDGTQGRILPDVLFQYYLPPFLEFNNTDKTLWNNGKGNVSSNTSFGDGALKTNTTGIYNTANGYNSLSLNTGSFNTAFGYESLKLNALGGSNVAFGVNALKSNTSADDNVSVGAYSMENNTTGSQNTAIGTYSLYLNSTGTNNTAIGLQPLYYNTTGSNNTAIGSSSGMFISGGVTPNVTGLNSTFIGSYTKPLGNSQTNQTVIGYNAIGNGSNTVTIGNSSITDNYFTGNIRGSAFIKSGGTSSQYLMADGSTTEFISALEYNNSEKTVWNNGIINNSSNTMFGEDVFVSNVSATNCTGFGYMSLTNNTTGSYNTSTGHQSLTNNTTGFSNTGIGSSSLYSNNTGDFNSATGSDALYSNTSGYSNSAIGSSALYSNTTGYNNTAIGNYSLYFNETGSNNTAIGYQSDVVSGALTNATAIGYGAIAPASNTVTIGNGSITDNYFTGNVRGGAFISSASAPVNGVTSGVLGEIRAAAGYIYVCSGGTVWTRATLTTY